MDESTRLQVEDVIANDQVSDDDELSDFLRSEFELTDEEIKIALHRRGCYLRDPFFGTKFEKLSREERLKLFNHKK